MDIETAFEHEDAENAVSLPTDMSARAASERADVYPEPVVPVAPVEEISVEDMRAGIAAEVQAEPAPAVVEAPAAAEPEPILRVEVPPEVPEAAPAKSFWEEARERARMKREERQEKWKERMERLRKAKDDVLDVVEMARDPQVREKVLNEVVDFSKEQGRRVKQEVVKIAKETGQAVGGAVKELAVGAAVVGIEAASIVGDPVLWVAGKTVLPALEGITDATGFVAEKVVSAGAGILAKAGEIEMKSRERVLRRKRKYRGFFGDVIEAAEEAGFSKVKKVAEGARDMNERSIRRAVDRWIFGGTIRNFAGEVRGFARRVRLASEKIATSVGALAEVATSGPIGSVIER